MALTRRSRVRESNILHTRVRLNVDDIPAWQPREPVLAEPIRGFVSKGLNLISIKVLCRDGPNCRI